MVVGSFHVEQFVINKIGEVKFFKQEISIAERLNDVSVVFDNGAAFWGSKNTNIAIKPMTAI